MTDAFDIVFDNRLADRAFARLGIAKNADYPYAEAVGTCKYAMVPSPRNKPVYGYVQRAICPTLLLVPSSFANFTVHV